MAFVRQIPAAKTTSQIQLQQTAGDHGYGTYNMITQ